jgi:hypothetical protein
VSGFQNRAVSGFVVSLLSLFDKVGLLYGSTLNICSPAGSQARPCGAASRRLRAAVFTRLNINNFFLSLVFSAGFFMNIKKFLAL